MTSTTPIKDQKPSLIPMKKKEARGAMPRCPYCGRPVTLIHALSCDERFVRIMEQHIRADDETWCRKCGQTWPCNAVRYEVKRKVDVVNSRG